jgi:hypothetical protein
MIINWPELDDSLDPFERWVGGLILAAITDGKLFEKKGWVLRKNSTKLNVVLTIEGEEVPFLPFLKRIYEDLNRQIQYEAKKLIEQKFSYVYDLIDNVKKSVLKRLPEVEDETL